MESFAGGSVSGNFSIDSCAPSLGMIVIFENEHPRALSQDKAIAVGGEWTRRTLGSMIPGLGERAQQRIAFDNSGRDGRIHTAHQEHRLHASLNVLVGVTDGVSGRGAAGSDYVAVPAKAEAHADFAGKRAHCAAGNAEDTDLLYVSAVPEPILFLGKFLRAAPGTEDHANLPFLVQRHGCGIEASILDCFCRSSKHQRHDARNVLAFTRIHPGQFVKLRNLAGNVYWERRG